MTINTLIIQFKNQIPRESIPLFRGAIVAAAGEDCSVLYHNHDGDNYRYVYPMIQYKTLGTRATIVCVEEGCNAINELFNNSNFQLRLGSSSCQKFEIETLLPIQTPISITDKEIYYHIENWLPLTPQNYQWYKQHDSLIERTGLLERILIGNILSVCKGLGITIEEKICCQIVQLSFPRQAKHKNTPILEFDAEFKCNISLPEYIGLGKGASLGHGTIYMIDKKTL